MGGKEITVEEKSNKIATEYLSGHDRFDITYEEMREAVMDMAEWKDQQSALLTQCAYERGRLDGRDEVKKYLEGLILRYEAEVKELKKAPDFRSNPIERTAVINRENYIRLIRYGIINELFNDKAI